METATLDGLETVDTLVISREKCCVPCFNRHNCPISIDAHCEIKKKCIDYLLKENIATIDEINAVIDSREQIMTRDKCGMIKDNPEHCWPITFAYGLGASHEMQFERAIAPYMGGAAYKRYFINQMGWCCAAVDIYRRTHEGHDPDLNEENHFLEENSPVFRALYAIWHGVTGKELDYPWAADAIKRERARKHETAEAVFH